MRSHSQIQARIKMASLLYFALPQNYRKKVTGFLTSEDISKILAYRKQKAEAEHYLAVTAALKNSLNKTHSLNTFSLVYLLIHIVYIVIALAFSHIVQAGAAIVYGVGGFFFFQKESPTYIRLRFYPVPFHLKYLVFTFLAYPAIMLPLGYYAGNSVSTPDNYILLFQAAILAPVFEEILFRDVLFKLLKDFTKSDFAIIAVTAALFAAVHLSFDIPAKILISELIVYFAAGLILGAIRWASCSLFYPLLLHIAVNTTVFYL